MKKILNELKSYIIIVIVVVLFRTFIATPVKVDGSSMSTTLENNDVLILNKLDKSYERFDIVVIKYGKNKLVKRVIGLPGDNIEYKDNELYINGEIIEDKSLSRTADFTLKELYNVNTIPEGFYFVMGDNRANSLDSRSSRVGMIDEKNIVGTTKIRLFPFSGIGKIN